jgi:hypothetical protein
MDTVKLRIAGTRPLLMHADVFTDPLNPLTKAHKALTGKRKKTDDDHEAIAMSEWRGGMYFDDEIGPYLPSVVLESAMISGGKLSKMGTQIKRSLEVIGDKCRLEYEGPRKVEALWAKKFYDARSVKVGQARIMRYRPMFKQWATECEIAFDPESMDRADIVRCMTDAGAYCGVGDYRPKFGRFSVAVL